MSVTVNIENQVMSDTEKRNSSDYGNVRKQAGNEGGKLCPAACQKYSPAEHSLLLDLLPEGFLDVHEEKLWPA